MRLVQEHASSCSLFEVTDSHLTKQQQAIRVCAESQLDTVTEKSAVAFAVDALARDKNAVPDFDSIELYEWALKEAAPPLDYAQTIGVLRARWAKANPASPNVVECLKACVLAWDLVNAQQVCLSPAPPSCVFI